jgi:hypothetical protein
MLTWFSTLNASIMASSRPRPAIAKPRDTRTSTEDVAGTRPVLRPTPAGRSLVVVSLLLSLPVTMLNGAPDAYDITYPNWKPPRARRTAPAPSPSDPLTTSRCRWSLSAGPLSARMSFWSCGV